MDLKYSIETIDRALKLLGLQQSSGWQFVRCRLMSYKGNQKKMNNDFPEAFARLRRDGCSTLNHGEIAALLWGREGNPREGVNIDGLIAAAREIERKKQLQENKTKEMRKIAGQVCKDPSLRKKLKPKMDELSSTVVDFGDPILDLINALNGKADDDDYK